MKNTSPQIDFAGEFATNNGSKLTTKGSIAHIFLAWSELWPFDDAAWTSLG